MEICRVHLLDCGPQEYGDAVLLQLGKVTILVDGAHTGDWQPRGPRHPGLTRQLADLLGQDADALAVDVLVVSHAHQDHIGCLPKLVENGLRARFALVVDPNS